MATSVQGAPVMQQAGRHVNFPPIGSTPTNSSTGNSRSISSTAPPGQSQQSPEPSQSLSSLLSSLSLPAVHSSSAAAATSAPSLFSSYILAILHTTLSDLHTVLALSPASLDEPSLASQPALLIALKEQLQLEHHYALLLQGWREMAEGDEGWAEQRRVVDEQYSCILDSTRSLLRLVSRPQTHSAHSLQQQQHIGGGSMAPVQGAQQAFYNLFSHLVALMTSRLHLSAKESDKQQHTLHALNTQHTHDAQTVQQLSQQLTTARSQHSTSLAQQHALLAKYQAALTNLLDGAEEETLNFNRTMKAAEEENERLFEGKHSELSEEDKRRRAEGLEQAMQDEWTKEEAMRRKVAIKQDEVARVIAQYDADMEFQEDVFNELSTLYEREREESRRLALYFERVKQRERKEAEELDRLRVRRDEEVRRDRESAESVRVLEQLFDGWMKKNAPKEKKKAADKKKKAYKTAWRPPRDNTAADDGAAAAAVTLTPHENEEAKESVTEAAAE